MFVTADTFHEARFPLNTYAFLNIDDMFTTADTSHEARSPSNMLAFENISVISVTADTFHCEMSQLNVSRLRKKPLISFTWLVSQPAMFGGQLSLYLRNRLRIARRVTIIEIRGIFSHTMCIFIFGG